VLDALNDHRILDAHDQHDSAPIALPNPRAVRLADQRQRPGVPSERIRGKLSELPQQSGRVAWGHELRLHRLRGGRRRDQLHREIVAYSDNFVKRRPSRLASEAARAYL
jgi:hypothetical protein